MTFPADQLDELRRYCEKLSALHEGNRLYLLLSKLQLPVGCTPSICDALLSPTETDGYPSRLYFSEMVASSFTRNWNVSNVRIAERNWVAFSWRVEVQKPTLLDMVLSHLTGFVREK